MSVPIESLPPEIIVNGQRQYLNPYQGTYSASRAYALRMQRGYARGLSQTQARRNVEAPPGYSESQIRRDRFRQIYGFDYSYYQALQRKYGSDIVNMRGGGISPQHIAMAMQLQAQGLLEPNWIEDRLAGRRYATDMYRQGNAPVGRVEFDTRIQYTAIEWWYYH